MAEEVEPQEKALDLPALKELAHNYQVPVSDSTLEDVAKDPARAKAFEGYLQTAAQGLYPTLAPQIKAGIPTGYLLDPYRQVGKQVFGPDFEPNFQSDPSARAALQGGFDPQTGRPAPMSLQQWTEHLKTDPAYGYASTPQGQAEITAMKQRVSQALSGS